MTQLGWRPTGRGMLQNGQNRRKKSMAGLGLERLVRVAGWLPVGVPELASGNDEMSEEEEGSATLLPKYELLRSNRGVCACACPACLSLSPVSLV